MGGAIADFVARDLAVDSANLIVSSGGDSSVRSSFPLEVHLYAGDSPLHEKLIMALPGLKKPFGIATYAPEKGLDAVTVLSRSACWASAFAKDIGTRLANGEQLHVVLDRAAGYSDVGGIVVIAGKRIALGGDLVLRSANGSAPAGK
jgi:ApbE superfamily uncharacterized protein (UPF0280 family)